MNNIVNDNHIKEQYQETTQKITNYLIEAINKEDRKYPRLIRKQRDKIKILLKFLTRIVERAKSQKKIVTKEELVIWQDTLKKLEGEFRSWKLDNLAGTNPKNTSRHMFFTSKERAPIKFPHTKVSSSYFSGKIH
ncbi:MAG: hypothetical protein AAB657_01440 [Patescibacteria group bacterium]